MPEVYGMFAPLLPQVARDELDAAPVRKRQGLVPDVMVHCRTEPGGPMRDVLVEFKTLHVGVSTYPGSSTRCRAVARRAAAIDAEYLSKSRRLDRRWHGTLEGHVGPVEAKLRSFGRVRGLVFGSWAEASDDVDWLLNQIAEIGCTRRRGLRAGRDEDDERVAILTALQRRWGLAAARANAQLLLRRLGHVGRGAAAASARRYAAREWHARKSRGLAAWARHRPRIWGMSGRD
eukprot:10277500-Karenia_brevis.AAC.1